MYARCWPGAQAVAAGVAAQRAGWRRTIGADGLRKQVLAKVQAKLGAGEERAVDVKNLQQPDHISHPPLSEPLQARVALLAGPAHVKLKLLLDLDRLAGDLAGHYAVAGRAQRAGLRLASMRAQTGGLPRRRRSDGLACTMR